MIKAVFFDLGGVLVRFERDLVIRRVARRLKQPVDQVAKYMWWDKVGHRLERGRITERGLYRLFRVKLGFSGTFAEFRTLWCDHFRENRPVVALMESIAKRMPTFLLSNTSAFHYDFITERFDFHESLHGEVLSYKLDARKPGPRIYREALKLAGVKASEAVFIDDLPENVAGARQMGLKALRYTTKRLKARLKAIGVLCPRLKRAALPSGGP